MKEFIAIDFETANYARASACSIGYVKVIDGTLSESSHHLIKPVGGHVPFHSKIHGITEADTCNEPMFDELFPSIREIFEFPLVGYSKFDLQVLRALFSNFDLRIDLDEYTDACDLAKQVLPELSNHKLKTLVKHFRLPKFKHHDAREDAVACANVFLRLQDHTEPTSPQFDSSDDLVQFDRLVTSILDDDEVDYKEACELFYFLEDNKKTSNKFPKMHEELKLILEDEILDALEAKQIKALLKRYKASP